MWMVGGGWSTLEANSVDLVVVELIFEVFVFRMLDDLENLSCCRKGMHESEPGP